MNDVVASENAKNKSAKESMSRNDYRKIKEVTEHTFWRFIGILIASSAYQKGGINLWEMDEGAGCHTMCTPINFGPAGENLMPRYRFVFLRKAFANAFHDKDSNSDWAKIRLLIDGYNSNRKKNCSVIS